MRTYHWLYLAAVLAAQTSIAGAQTDAPDAVIASPDKYSVLLENEYVRVVEYRIEPGEREPWHTHPAKVAYILESGQLRITPAGGKSFDVSEQRGNARWQNAVGPHYGENIGDTPVQILLVEIKGADTPVDDLSNFTETADRD